MENRISETKMLQVYASFKFTKGVIRGVAIDLEKNGFFLVPNDLIKFLSQNTGVSVNEIFNKYHKEEHKVINEYLEILEENNAIFYSNVPISCFPKISDEWDSFSLITNCIFDMFNDSNIENVTNVLKELEQLNCQHIEIRLLYDIEKSNIKKILALFETSGIRGIVLTFRYLNNIDFLTVLFKDFSRLSYINLYDSKTNTIDTDLAVNLISSESPSISCGFISAKDFTMNIDAYTESRKHNSCLNRKLYLNLETGDVKNCPSLPKIHGNFLTDDLLPIINSKDFQKYWHITKSEIEVCRDCEFRDICSDCRAFTEKNSLLSKPLKCGYDPYTGIWKDWKSNKKKYEQFKKQIIRLK